MRIAELAEAKHPPLHVFASVVVMIWEVAQLVCGIVKLEGVHASEAVADAEIQRAHELVVARAGDKCASSRCCPPCDIGHDGCC